jgi:hypothetical protein
MATRTKDWNQILQEASENYAELLDTTSTANTIYEGIAAIGSATSSPVWQIRRTNTSTLVATWADSNDAFDNIWDNRTSLNYG